MTVGDWQRAVCGAASDWPVFFYTAGGAPLPAERYCTGSAVRCTRYWDGSAGWRPCLLVDLGGEC